MKGRIGVAVTLFADDSDHPRHVLLGHRIKQDGFGLWVLPGGGVEDNENPVEAIERETWEEVGVNIEAPCAVYHSYDPNVGGPDGCVMLYYTETCGRDDPKLVATHEFSELRWFDIDSLPIKMWASDRKAVNRAVHYWRYK